MKKIAVSIILAAGVVAVPVTASAQTEGCTTVDYQGAPLEMCPPQEPDPTNCYWGDYQGAPIEICMPTGWVPDPTWTFKGEPIVMHDSTEPVVATGLPPVPPTPAPAPAPAPQSTWLDELQVILVQNGGW